MSLPPASTMLGAVATALLATAAWFGSSVSLPIGRPLFVNVGPNDGDYVGGFREDWERDGLTRFRWSTREARVQVPFRLEGDGFRLRLRGRRYLPDPAEVHASVGGQRASTVILEPQAGYATIEVALPRLGSGRDARVELLVRTPDPRPLGVAIDWFEIYSDSRLSAVHLKQHTRLRVVLCVTGTLVLLMLGGLALGPASIVSALMLATIVTGFGMDAIAAERVLRHGLGAFLSAMALAVLCLRFQRVRAALRLEDSSRGWLVLAIMAALCVRLVLVLHQSFYYPDVTIHAVFAGRLAGGGLARFLAEFTENQFRHSLGLQFENGHWYAFPYPPTFYFLAAPLARLGYRPEVAVSLVPAVLNSLETIVVFGLARRFGLRPDAALAAAIANVVLPIFTARLSLAYFPALAGHFADAVALLALAAAIDRLERPRWIVGLAVLILLALLTYTQSILNWAVLLALTLALSRAPAFGAWPWRRLFGLACAGLAAAALALILFYGKYFAVLRDIRAGVAMAGEEILLEKLARAPAEPGQVDQPDPFAGPTFDAGRGLRKAIARATIFYGPFAAAVALGLFVTVSRTPLHLRGLLAAWITVYFVLNFASGSLPGPNLVRYNKDLEIVAPLFAIGLAATGEWLWKRARLVAALYGLGYLAFGTIRAVGYFVERSVVER